MDHRYRKFLKLVELGSFSSAAKALRISQPAMTISIASLEHSLGKKLIIRRKKLIELTAEGEIVYNASKKIASEINKMNYTLAEGKPNNITHIGIIDSIAHLLYTSPSQHTVLNNLEVMVDNSIRIINELTTGKIDFGLITGQPSSLSEDISVQKLHNEPFVFVASPNKVPKDKVLEINNWLAYNQASTSYKHFLKQFEIIGLKVKPSFYSTSMELLKEMAIKGNGIALLPSHFVDSDIKEGRLGILNTKPLFRPLWIISNKNKKAPKLQVDLSRSINNLLPQ
jgi:DNA-binding transcriptional LysR family regulator